MQVTEEGGTDAVVEAPAIYAALDSLGQRVAAWTERQHRAGQPLGGDPADGVLSPEEAAACAARAIKQVPTARAAAAAARAQRVGLWLAGPALTAPVVERSRSLPEQGWCCWFI